MPNDEDKVKTEKKNPEAERNEIEKANPVGLLSDDSEFLCEPSPGSIEPLNGVDISGDTVKISETAYYTFLDPDAPEVPQEVLITGDTKIIKKFLDDNSAQLSETQKMHFQNRISTMNYLNKLEEYNYTYSPVKIPASDIKLDRKQDTVNGCWSCAFSLLLQGRGVALDQKLIRAYRPVLSMGEAASRDPGEANMLNSNSMGDITNLYSLVDKLCPNTIMENFSYTKGLTSKKAVLSYLEMTLNNNIPVAFSNDGHWRTLVKSGNKYKIIDSASSVFPKEVTVDPEKLFDSCSFLGFVALKDLEPEKQTDISVGPDGEILSKDRKQFGYFEDKAAPVGTGFRHNKTDKGFPIYTYYPGMKRDFQSDYRTQKKAVQNSLRKDHIVPKDTGYHYITTIANVNQKAQAELNNAIYEKNAGIITKYLIEQYVGTLNGKDLNIRKKIDDSRKNKDGYYSGLENAVKNLQDVKDFIHESLEKKIYDNAKKDSNGKADLNNIKFIKDYTSFLKKKYKDKKTVKQKLHSLVSPQSELKKSNQIEEEQLQKKPSSETVAEKEAKAAGTLIGFADKLEKLNCTEKLRSDYNNIMEVCRNTAEKQKVYGDAHTRDYNADRTGDYQKIINKVDIYLALNKKTPGSNKQNRGADAPHLKELEALKRYAENMKKMYLWESDIEPVVPFNGVDLYAKQYDCYEEYRKSASVDALAKIIAYDRMKAIDPKKTANMSQADFDSRFDKELEQTKNSTVYKQLSSCIENLKKKPTIRDTQNAYNLYFKARNFIVKSRKNGQVSEASYNDFKKICKNLDTSGPLTKVIIKAVERDIKEIKRTEKQKQQEQIANRIL